MLRMVIVYGLVAGLIVGLPLSIFTIAWPDLSCTSAGMVIGYAVMLIAFSTIVVAIRRRRAALGGVIRFLPAFGLGLGISAVASACYVVAWELSVAISGFDFPAKFAATMIAQQEANGVSGAALDQFRAEMETFKINYANPLWRIPMSFAEMFPVGALVSLVSAALLRNPRVLPALR